MMFTTLCDRSDLLLVNKTDLAPHVGADLDRMRHDAGKARPDLATEFTDLRAGKGVENIVKFICHQGGLRHT